MDSGKLVANVCKHLQSTLDSLQFIPPTFIFGITCDAMVLDVARKSHFTKIAHESNQDPSDIRSQEP